MPCSYCSKESLPPRRNSRRHADACPRCWEFVRLRVGRHGSPEAPKIPTVLERMESRIQPEPNTGCWLWTGATNSDGYGFVWHNRKNEYAHRVMYSEKVGQIPEGLQLDHLCEQKCCVNPSHLRATTARENILRSGAPTARNHRKIRCINGHLFTTENTYVYSRGDFPRRMCKTCCFNNQRERREKIKCQSRA